MLYLGFYGPHVHGQCSNTLTMASRKKYSVVEVLKQLDLSDEECFDDDNDDNRDCDRGPEDVEPMGDVDSEATEDYDGTAADEGHVSSDPDSESGIDAVIQTDDSPSTPVSTSCTCLASTSTLYFL